MASKQGVKPVKGKYIDTLDKTARERYEEKLKLIGGTDPYTVEKKNWKSEHDGLPEITYFDIVNYLVYSTSAYTMEHLKGYKSLEAYNQFVCGWVRDVNHMEMNDKVILTAKVRHSQRLNESSLSPWVVARKEGTIDAAHCTCMAGLGEVCSHVAALLFWVESAVKIRNSRTVTQEPAYWLLPTGLRNVDYDMIKDINFQSAKTMKRRLDTDICCSPAPKPVASKLPDVPPLNDEEFDTLLEKLHLTRTRPVVLAVMPKYASSYIPESVSDSFPEILSGMYDESCLEMAKDELIAHCSSLMTRITVTAEQAQSVEKQTRCQAKNKDWFRFRTGRITASRLKSVCHANPNQPPKSLIQAICYPEKARFSTKATKWGCDHEADAVHTYCETVKGRHENFQCTESGLILSSELPFMGASPDSLISCDCCGEGTLEVKCPYCVRSQNCIESVARKSCLELLDGKLQLKRTHAYYYQVQAQIFLCDRDFCDFVVWTQNDIHIERIEADESFWLRNVEKAKTFFLEVVLPELVGKLYSRPRGEPKQPVLGEVNLQPSTSGKDAVETDSDDAIICICQQKYSATYGKVIGCDNENCQYKWLHFSCVGIKRAPKGMWFCPTCRELPGFARVKSKV